MAADAGTVRERYAAALRRGYGASTHTMLAYLGDLDDFADNIEMDDDSTWRGVQLADIRSTRAHMAEDGKSRSTLARRGAAIRTFFAWAHRTGLIDHNPALRLASARPASTLPEVLGVDDMSLLLDVAQVHADSGDPLDS